MSTTVGPRERAIFCRHLTPILFSLIGHSTRIQLKSEISVYGKITGVDCFMNVTLEKGELRRGDGQTVKFEFFFLQRKSIRNVDIPSYLPMEKLIENQMKQLDPELKRQKKQKDREKWQTFKKNRAARRAKKNNKGPKKQE